VLSEHDEERREPSTAGAPDAATLAPARRSRNMRRALSSAEAAEAASSLQRRCQRRRGPRGRSLDRRGAASSLHGAAFMAGPVVSPAFSMEPNESSIPANAENM